MGNYFFKLQLVLVIIPLFCLGMFSLMISYATTKAKRRHVREEQLRQKVDPSDPVIKDNLLEQTTLSAKSRKPAIPVVQKNIFAYVFCIAEQSYFCHAFVNIHRLINDLEITQFADIVLLVMQDLKIPEIPNCKDFKCFGKQFKIIVVPKPPSLMPSELDNKRLGGFRYCFVKFEAFKLSYQRLVVVDPDGLILRSLDHLFLMNLRGYDVAASYANYFTNKKWLSSALLVVNPNQQLYDEMTKLLNGTSIKPVSKYANGNIYDMDILNYVFKSGVLARILPDEYGRWDTEFATPRESNKRLNETYYVHFSFRKPHKELDSKKWISDSRVSPSNESNFLRIFETYWAIADRICSP